MKKNLWWLIVLFMGVWFTFSTFASGETALSIEGLAPNCIAARESCGNVCSRMSSTSEWACTLMACAETQTPITYTCTKYEANANYLPETCVKGNDGCNSCFRTTIQDARGCTKMYCQDPGPASCSEYAKWPFAIVKEGELTNGSVSPDYAKICLPGLATINPYATGLLGAGMLCYNPTKGLPVCHGASLSWYSAEGWYYPDWSLLRMMDCIQEEQMMCTMQYQPVCASVAVQCIKAPCPAQLQTFGNACVMGTNKLATYIHDGECIATDVPWLKPGEWFVYNKITSFLNNAYQVRGFWTDQMITYTQTIVDKIDNLFMTAKMRPYALHRYQQLKSFLEIYMGQLAK